MVCTFMTMLPATRIFASASSRDRKSTRLNSSHSQISYAVFCLKKKKNYSRYHFPNFQLAVRDTDQRPIGRIVERQTAVQPPHAVIATHDVQLSPHVST